MSGKGGVATLGVTKCLLETPEDRIGPKYWAVNLFMALKVPLLSIPRFPCPPWMSSLRSTGILCILSAALESRRVRLVEKNVHCIVDGSKPVLVQLYDRINR